MADAPSPEEIYHRAKVEVHRRLSMPMLEKVSTTAAGVGDEAVVAGRITLPELAGVVAAALRVVCGIAVDDVLGTLRRLPVSA